MNNICTKSAALILLQQRNQNFQVYLQFNGKSWGIPESITTSQDNQLANENKELIDKYHSSFYNKLFTDQYPTQLMCAFNAAKGVGVELDINDYIMNSQPLLRLITPQNNQDRHDTQFYVYSSLREIEINFGQIMRWGQQWNTPEYHLLYSQRRFELNIFLQLLALREQGSINNVYEYIKMVNKEHQYNVTFPFLFQFKQIQDQNVQNIIQYPDQLFDMKSAISNENDIALKTELERRMEYSQQAKKFRFIQTEDDTNFKFESQIDLPYYSFLSCLKDLKFQREKNQSHRL